MCKQQLNFIFTWLWFNLVVKVTSIFLRTANWYATITAASRGWMKFQALLRIAILDLFLKFACKTGPHENALHFSRWLKLLSNVVVRIKIELIKECETSNWMFIFTFGPKIISFPKRVLNWDFIRKVSRFEGIDV